MEILAVCLETCEGVTIIIVVTSTNEHQQFHGHQHAPAVASGKRLKRMANRHGWTPSDASARLVEEGLRRSEFAFIDFRDSLAGRQAYMQGSTLAVWEVMLLSRS